MTLIAAFARVGGRKAKNSDDTIYLSKAPHYSMQRSCSAKRLICQRFTWFATRTMSFHTCAHIHRHMWVQKDASAYLRYPLILKCLECPFTTNGLFLCMLCRLRIAADFIHTTNLNEKFVRCIRDRDVLRTITCHQLRPCIELPFNDAASFQISKFSVYEYVYTTYKAFAFFQSFFVVFRDSCVQSIQPQRAISKSEIRRTIVKPSNLICICIPIFKYVLAHCGRHALCASSLLSNRY